MQKRIIRISPASTPSTKLTGFTIVELLVAIVIIGILATLTIISYTGIQQKAIVASINSDLDNASRSLKLFQVENNDNYPLTNDCSSTPAANSICLKSSPGNSYTVFETNNSGSRSFCLTVKNSTTNAKYHITQDSAPTLGVCPFGFATTLTATTASPTSIDLVWDTVTDATSYTLEQATDESFTTDLTTIATQPGTSFTSISLSQGTTYYYRVNATIDGDISGWSNTDDATTSIDAPDAPTVSANTVTDTTTWSWNTPTCPAGSARYQYRYTIAPSGSDSGLVPIASSPIVFTTNTEGQTYTVQVQAQCFLGAIISSWSTSGSAEYYRIITYTLTTIAGISGTVSAGGTYNTGTVRTITATPSTYYSFTSWTGSTGCSGVASHTITMDANKSCTANFTPTAIAAPATPGVTANTAANTTTWSWGAASCPGNTARYQYTSQVQAQCYNAVTTSAWGATGQASYIRPVANPGPITFGIIRTSSTYINLTATSSCTSGSYLETRADLWITDSYGGYNWWWPPSGLAGWWSNGGPWFHDTFTYYGSSTWWGTTNSDGLPSGMPWKLAVEMRCKNWTTGLTSASTGRVESPILYAP